VLSKQWPHFARELPIFKKLARDLQENAMAKTQITLDPEQALFIGQTTKN
jgi:hypothetical protein